MGTKQHGFVDCALIVSQNHREVRWMRSIIEEESMEEEAIKRSSSEVHDQCYVCGKKPETIGRMCASTGTTAPVACTIISEPATTSLLLISKHAFVLLQLSTPATLDILCFEIELEQSKPAN